MLCVSHREVHASRVFAMHHDPMLQTFSLTLAVLAHGGGGVCSTPAFMNPQVSSLGNPPLAPARACPSTEWALNRCFHDFLGPLFFVVLDAELSISDALTEGKRGSAMSVIVRSVHNNIVPHIATRCCLF